MHDAPSVSFPVGRCVWCRRISLALWCAAIGSALGVAIWARQPLGVGAVLVMVGGLGFAWGWRHGWPQGHLQWRGQVPAPMRGWWWARDETEPAVRVTELFVLLDLQHGMLLALRLPTQQRLTMWVQRAHAPVQWQALRQAVWFHVGDAA